MARATTQRLKTTNRIPTISQARLAPFDAMNPEYTVGSGLMLRLVIPKGSLENQTLALFEAADIRLMRGSDRDYHGTVDDPRLDRFSLLRPQEIPKICGGGVLRRRPDRPGLGPGDRRRCADHRRAGLQQGQCRRTGDSEDCACGFSDSTDITASSRCRPAAGSQPSTRT